MSNQFEILNQTHFVLTCMDSNAFHLRVDITTTQQYVLKFILQKWILTFSKKILYCSTSHSDSIPEVHVQKRWVLAFRGLAEGHRLTGTARWTPGSSAILSRLKYNYIYTIVLYSLFRPALENRADHKDKERKTILFLEI